MSRRTDKSKIFELIKEYYYRHLKPEKFTPGKTRLHYAGRVFAAREFISMVDSVLDGWITLGDYAQKLETALRKFFRAKDVILVNSGSSANLLVVCTLMSEKIKNQLRKGDEVITPALSFPTTFAPLIQMGLIPVLVDCKIGTYNIDERKIKQAISEKTKAILVPHTLGNPCNMEIIKNLCTKYHLYLIEDVCDALGAKFNGRYVGTFGNLATLSFYAAHHLTMGEGGAVIVNDMHLSQIIRSLRDWGRDCFCQRDVSQNGACGRRFDYKIKLPHHTINYDHRYIYSHIGYNLKPTDIQAALGLAQFKRLNDFISKRNENFKQLYRGLKKFDDKFILPCWERKAKPSWFAFPLSLRAHCDFSRYQLLRFLERYKIETRLLFAGNIIRQPAYRSCNFKIIDNLKNTDFAMEHSFFVGVYPGLNKEMIKYMISIFEKFFNEN